MTKNSSKKILLTGAAGFIGSNLLEYLFDKYPDYVFTILDSLTYAGNFKNIPEKIKKSSRFKFVYDDIRNVPLVDNLVKDTDIVIHLAAETHVTRSIYDDAKFFETDVIGTQAIANAIRNHQKTIERFLHISTCEVYGAGLTKKMDENHPLNPHSPYAAAKAGADRLVYSYYVTHKIPAIIIRPFNIFGPRQHLEKAVPRFITSAILREPFTIHGNGKSERDYMYVSDLTNAIDLLMHAPAKQVIGEVFNVGSGKAISILEIAQFIAKQMKIPASHLKFTEDRPGQVSTFACNYSKINKLLGWQPKINLSDGLKNTILWYKNNYDVWKDQIWLRQIPITLATGITEML